MGEAWEMALKANVNGVALAVALVHAVVVGVACYAWGYTDGAARREGGGRAA